MSYIEEIRKNVADAIATRKNAKINNIDYLTAKIMYHNGANDIDLETAKMIRSALADLKITPYMLDTFDYTDFNIFGLDEYTLNVSIHNKIKRKYIEELSKSLGADYLYGKAIASLMRRGITLKGAVLLFEAKLKYEMKKNNLSEIAALAKILYFNNNESSKVFEQAYLNNRTVCYQPLTTLKNELISNCEYKKKNINGITLLSKTEKGLKKLESIVIEAFKTGSKELVTLLPKVAAQNNLILSDIKPLEESKPSCYIEEMKYIYINISHSHALLNVFYHEVTHFLDNIKSNKQDILFYSVENPIVNSLLEKIKETMNPLRRGLSLAHFTNLKAIRYATDRKLNQKRMQEIKETYPNLNTKNYKILLTKRIIAERKKFKIFAQSLGDIYDSLTDGKLESYSIAPGHGRKYYREKKYIPIEFIANIGEICNANATDILRFEFGDELADQLIAMYHEFMNTDEFDQKTI